MACLTLTATTTSGIAGGIKARAILEILHHLTIIISHTPLGRENRCTTSGLVKIETP